MQNNDGFKSKIYSNFCMRSISSGDSRWLGLSKIHCDCLLCLVMYVHLKRDRRSPPHCGEGFVSLDSLVESTRRMALDDISITPRRVCKAGICSTRNETNRVHYASGTFRSIA